MSGSESSVDNISQFQYLMYRPLYMFGFPGNNHTTLNPTLSLASVPEYSNGNTDATIALNNYKWSNGETVTAADVLFFMNMMHAGKGQLVLLRAGIVPRQRKERHHERARQWSVHLQPVVHPTWMTYNEFSQITPFPTAWDITAAGAASGSGGCSTGTYGAAATDTACAKVWTFLHGCGQRPRPPTPPTPSGASSTGRTIAASKGGSFQHRRR